jgi:hypothetical protein
VRLELHRHDLLEADSPQEPTAGFAHTSEGSARQVRRPDHSHGRSSNRRVIVGAATGQQKKRRPGEACLSRLHRRRAAPRELAEGAPTCRCSGLLDHVRAFIERAGTHDAQRNPNLG